MNTFIRVFLVCGWLVMWGIAASVQGQQQGLLNAADVAPPASETMLPPGAVYEREYVQHPVQSSQENLHLLASFYYGNPREWRRIYDDNRAVIANPNRLPVGEVLRIHVGANWQPYVAYDTWFALAVRNGEWQPGVPWQRARTAKVPLTAPASTAPAPTPRPAPPSEPDAPTAPSATPTPMPTAAPPTDAASIPAEAPPSEHPAGKPAAEPAAEPEEPPSPTPEADAATQPAEEDVPDAPAF